jgi:hypothetical protein
MNELLQMAATRAPMLVPQYLDVMAGFMQELLQQPAAGIQPDSEASRARFVFEVMAHVVVGALIGAIGFVLFMPGPGGLPREIRKALRRASSRLKTRWSPARLAQQTAVLCNYFGEYAGIKRIIQSSDSKSGAH